MDDLKCGMVLAGNAFLGHGRATGLSEGSVTNLNSVSVAGKLSPSAFRVHTFNHFVDVNKMVLPVGKAAR
jgi:hypothetical protein